MYICFSEFFVKPEKYVAEGVQVGNLFLSEGVVLSTVISLSITIFI